MSFLKDMRELLDLPDKLTAVTAERDLLIHLLTRLTNTVLAEEPHTPKSLESHYEFHTNEKGEKLQFVYYSHPTVQKVALEVTKEWKV